MVVATQGSNTLKKASTSSKRAASHPPYIQMIRESLLALKETRGSSHYAIAKHIEEEQKIKNLPPNFKKLLFIQLKKFVASGKLVKVKNSFKLAPSVKPKAASAAAKPKPKAAAAEKKKAAATPGAGKKKVKTPVKVKKPKSIKSPAKKRAAPAAARRVLLLLRKQRSEV